MRPAIFLAQTALPEFHPAEVLFFKLASLVVLLLWKASPILVAQIVL